MSTLNPPTSRPRAGTFSGPHALSLKVLRLSRPTLATHTPLPSTTFGDGLDIPASASLAYPQTKSFPATTFPLTPLLTLPSAFGAAYVGETFACTLCANNELEGLDGNVKVTKAVWDVKISAELQSPSHRDGVPLELFGEDEDEEEDEDDEEEGEKETTEEQKGVSESRKGLLHPGKTLQRTLRHELKEEGPHVLAVSVTYTEEGSASSPSSGGHADQQQPPPPQPRTRTFRKLYQFVAQQLVAVRSKVTERTSSSGTHTRARARTSQPTTTPASQSREWVLEAQLENVGESSVVIEKVLLNARPGIRSWPLNHDSDDPPSISSVVLLKPQDIEQVMFVVVEDEENPKEEEGGESSTGRKDHVRVPLAQMQIKWRNGMGEVGGLTTGWLASRGR